MKRRLVPLAAMALAGCNAHGDGMGNILRGTGIAAREPDYDVPYVPTPEPVVDAMLDMAGVAAGDVVIDLGSGDGRIAIAAARRGATASGVEIDAALVERARRNAALVGMQEQARFTRADLFDVPLRQASVVTMYLLPRINLTLRPRLLTQLRPGTRIVSHAFDMADWRPDGERLVGDRRVYLWIVPAVAGGRWQATMADGRTVALTLDQRFQVVTGTLGDTVVTGTLRGTALRLSAGGRTHVATVGENAIVGDGWRAVRAE